MTVAALTIDFLWSLSLSIILWVLISIALPKSIDAFWSVVTIVLVTVVTFGASVLFDVTSGLSFVIGIGVVSLVNGNWTLFTFPFILATVAILIAVMSAIWAFIDRMANGMA